MRSLKFTSEESGRVDRVLTSEIGESRSQIRRLISAGAVKVNGKSVKKGGYLVSKGDVVEYILSDGAIPDRVLDIDFDIDIIYEDMDILVINKPSKLVVHPAPSVKGATVVDWLTDRGFSLSTIAGEYRSGIVHRLDRDTTGVMVIAKTNMAHRALSEQLKDRSMGRYYLALIDYPLKDNSIVEKPIGRNHKNRLKMDIVGDGRYAKSAFYKILEGRASLELIAVKLYTGRTHQIRVHLNSIGRHILGDILYGFKSKQDTIDRVMLHAYKLYLIHPTRDERMEFVAPLFSDMREFIYQNFNQGEVDEKICPDIIDSYFYDVSRWVQFKQHGGL